MSAPSDPRFQIARGVAAAAGYLAVIVVQVERGLAHGELGAGAGWLCVALLISLPVLTHVLVRMTVPFLPPRLQLAPQALQLLPFFLVPLDPPGLPAFALLVLVQGNLLVHATTPRAVPWSLAGGPALLLAGIAVAPARVWMLLLPLGLVTTLAALVLAQTTLLREAGRHLPPRADEGAPRGDGWRVPLHAVGLAAVVLACLPVLLGVYALLPRPLVGPAAPVEGWAPPEGPAGSANAVDARTAFDEIFQSGISFTRGDTAILGEDVMEVRPFPDGPGTAPRRMGLVYLRGVLLDTFHTGGMRYGDATPLVRRADGDDGAVDGWTQLADLRPGVPLVPIDVVQQPILVRGGTRGVLFAPERTVGIELDEVHHSPDGLLECPAPPAGMGDAWFAYRLLVEERRAEMLDLTGARFAPGRAGDCQLPPPSNALRTFEAAARAIMAGARTDSARVAAVVRHFQEDFEYSLEARTPPGLRGLAEFLERRRGYCTYFATAAVLLLRTQGIPARVATGFLARDWSEEERCYLVTTANAHAWIEVRYEGIGWVTYEPTPADGRQAALASALRDPSSGLGAWAAEMLHDLGRWLESGDEGWLGTLGSTLADLPQALWRTVRRMPFLALVVLGPVLTWLLLRRWRGTPRGGRRGAGGPGTAGRSGPMEVLHQRLLGALARLGFHPRPPQTPREFAREVRARGGAAFAPLLPLTDALYRTRYGGLEPPRAALDEARAFLQALARMEGGSRRRGNGESAIGSEPGEAALRPRD